MMNRLKNLIVKTGLLSVMFYVLIANLYAQSENWSDCFLGEGTQASPYLIKDPDDLIKLADNVNNGTKATSRGVNKKTGEPIWFKLANDLDMAGKSMSPIGHNTGSGGTFDGCFDGGGHVIKNLKIEVEHHNVGLFGYINNYNSIIKNVGLVNANVSGTMYVGALIGNVTEMNYITNCYLKGTSTIKANSYYTPAGGGYCDRVSFVGGLVGLLAYGNPISYCYVEGATISGFNGVGGIIGRNQLTGNNSDDPGVVDNCFSLNNTITVTLSSNATCEKYIGAIVGSLSEKTDKSVDGDISDSYYYDGQNEGYYTTSTGGVVKTTEENIRNMINSLFSGNNNLKLYVNKWNLIGSLNNSNLEPLRNNTGGNDAACVEWSLTDNNWKYADEDFLLWKSSIKQGYGYFAHVFPNKPLEEGQTVGKELTNTTTMVQITNSSTGDIKYTETNTGTSTTGSGSQKGYWFSLSNPFSEDLSVVNLVAANAGIVGGNTVYIYDSSVPDWKTITSSATDTKTIQPGQGFMVYSPSSTPKQVSLTMKYDDKTIVKTTGSKSSSVKSYENVAPLTIFKVYANNKKKEIFARQAEYAVDGYDNGDALVLFSDNNSIVSPYFVVDDNEVIINEFKNLPYTTPICFHSFNTTDAKLKLKNIPEDMLISMIDLQTNEETVLEEDSIFSFTVYEGENEGRFSIKFAKKNSSSLLETKVDNINIWNDDKDIYINGNDLKNVQLINSLGQVIYNKNLNGSSFKFTTNATCGAYIVVVKTNNGTKFNKIIIK
ncbi:MAG: T9SS type A sorting domain-containing protein [Bacteroidales bacterium]|nr:T9SS type A sorting domain-containing protein [Bacteroidales bacterium]